MALGLVLAGILTGLVSAGLMLAFGAGFGMAVLAYVGCGCVGVVFLAVMSLMKQDESRSKVDELRAAPVGGQPR